MAWPEDDGRIDGVVGELAKAHVLEPVALGARDEALWLDCDLASLAENRLGDVTDPRALDDERRSDWGARALDERPWPLAKRAEFESCHWLVHRGERAGTIAVAGSLLGGVHARISSLYVFPNQRGAGVARSALGAIRSALATRDLGLRLSTSWTWQRVVRFYLRLGMWVRLWKRDLELQWSPQARAPLVDVGERRATFAVDIDGRRVELYRAERQDGRLVLHETQVEESLEELSWEALSTFATELALAGWPLVRSATDWEECRFSDAMAPESLAYKITIWEAWSKKHGWRVDAPRIEGLAYPTWDELEARWRAEDVDLELAKD